MRTRISLACCFAHLCSPPLRVLTRSLSGLAGIAKPPRRLPTLWPQNPTLTERQLLSWLCCQSERRELNWIQSNPIVEKASSGSACCSILGSLPVACLFASLARVSHHIRQGPKDFPTLFVSSGVSLDRNREPACAQQPRTLSLKNVESTKQFHAIPVDKTLLASRAPTDQRVAC